MTHAVCDHAPLCSTSTFHCLFSRSSQIRPMKPLVFVGPSLSHRECLQLLHADLLPPVRRGDLNSLAPGRVVAIIDGELPPDDLLPDSELSDALDRRVALYGAASVGAWRAATFSAQGMYGIGWVYDQYVAGTLTSFDEIAAIYDPLSLQNLSVPLVNVRFWLRGLMAESRVTPDDVRTALEELRHLPVVDRDILAIKKRLRDVLHQNSVQKELDTVIAFPDIKRNDAKRLLGFLASMQKRPPDDRNSGALGTACSDFSTSARTVFRR